MPTNTINAPRPVLNPQAKLRKPRRDEDREYQRDRSEALILQKHEHLARRIDAPFPGKGGIARIVR
jgi:hypothetical protein